MVFEDIKIKDVEEAARIKELKNGFYRMIFNFSDSPPKDWIPLFSEEYTKIKSINIEIETIGSFFIIVNCKLDDMQTILNDFKKAALRANEIYKKKLVEKQKKQEELTKKYLEKKKKVDEVIEKLNFD